MKSFTDVSEGPRYDADVLHMQKNPKEMKVPSLEYSLNSMQLTRDGATY